MDGKMGLGEETGLSREKAGPGFLTAYCLNGSTCRNARERSGLLHQDGKYRQGLVRANQDGPYPTYHHFLAVWIWAIT